MHDTQPGRPQRRRQHARTRVRQRHLGARTDRHTFRRLREAGGLTQTEVANYLYRHVGSYGNLERADPRVSISSERDVRRMAELCNADDETLERLLQFAEATRQNSPFTQYRDVMSAEFGMYADMTQSAEPSIATGPSWFLGCSRPRRTRARF